MKKQLPLPTAGSPLTPQRGFALIELLVSAAIMAVVVGVAVSYIAVSTQRSQAEQTKVDLTQEGRGFVDEFERDIHQAGYPGCALFNTVGRLNCATAASYNNTALAVGLVSISSTNVVFEGDVDGDGVVDSVQYRLVDSATAYPPAGTCPCTIQRSQVPKAVGGVWPAAYNQVTNWSQELDNVVNSGVPVGNAVYGGGLSIAGNLLAGGTTNDAYYAAVTTFKDYPVFSAYDQYGNIVPLPLNNTTGGGQTSLASIKSIRLTINLLGNAASGYDLKTGVRPVVTMVGNGRRNNKMAGEN